MAKYSKPQLEQFEDNTILGAGSTFTDTVPAGSLAIARQRQINLEQKANDIWRKKGKK